MMPTAVQHETHGIHTRFGRFDVEDDDVITFAEGMPAFERCRRFVLLSSESIAPLKCLHGLDESAPSFLAIDPTIIQPRYQMVLSGADRIRLGDNDADLVWLALVTWTGGRNGVVNLRAPVVINARRMLGVQLVPARSQYALSHPLTIG
jgi:flagellar assembly factor FliW